MTPQHSLAHSTTVKERSQTSTECDVVEGKEQQEQQQQATGYDDDDDEEEEEEEEEEEAVRTRRRTTTGSPHEGTPLLRGPPHKASYQSTKRAHNNETAIILEKGSVAVMTSTTAIDGTYNTPQLFF